MLHLWDTLEFSDKQPQLLGVALWIHRPPKTNLTLQARLNVTRWTHKSNRTSLTLQAIRSKITYGTPKLLLTWE